MAGIVAGILITLSSAGRGWRALSAVGFLIGVSTLIAAWKGMCVVSDFFWGGGGSTVTADEREGRGGGREGPER